MRRWPANRIPRIRPQPHLTQARRHRRRSPSTRPSRHPVQRIRIPRNPRNRALRHIRRKRPLRHIRLPQHNRPRIPHPLHHKSVGSRHNSLHRQRPTRRLQPFRVVVVLHNHDNPMQRPHRMRPFELRIQTIRVRQRLRIHQNHRVQMRRLVIRLHPLDISLDKLPASHLPRTKRGLRLRNRRLPHIKRRAATRRTTDNARTHRHSNQQQNKNTAHQTSIHRSSFNCGRATTRTTSSLSRYYTVHRPAKPQNFET